MNNDRVNSMIFSFCLDVFTFCGLVQASKQALYSPLEFSAGIKVGCSKVRCSKHGAKDHLEGRGWD
ncbi:hypothetical protein CY35_03G123900 [Sphagnum magellanicum]|nr:hypothetical protein CY35_03G123900 [Sphagnum magellanicum]